MSNERDSIIEEIESRGAALEDLFEADSCRNIDRIARLPGSVNWPTKDKREKKGQLPALSDVLRCEPDLHYSLSAFPTRRRFLGSSKPVDITNHNMPIVISNTNDLDQFNLSDRTKRIVLEGRIREEAKRGDDSDSGWLLRGILCLMKEGLLDEAILSIIKNPSFGISAHLQKHGRRIDQYALRQVQRARAFFSNKQESWDVTKKDGTPYASYHNARIAIRDLGVTCKYNVFHNRMIVGGEVLQTNQGDLNDRVTSMLRRLIFEKFGFDAKKEHIHDSIYQLCLEHVVDPVCDYLDGLEWDGIERLDTYFITHFGAQDTQLNRSIGRVMLIAAVRRAREPGCKHDLIVVLEGAQGTGKSTALEILAGKSNFSDQNILALDARAQMEAIEGVWIYEISELEGLRRSEIGSVKAFASRKSDRARAAYARYSEDRPRRCIFVGTTNEDQYLRDKTGNRRFLPVRVGTVDLDGLKVDRDQLWAEAAFAEAKGESINLPRELWLAAAKIQASRVEYDEWIDILSRIDGDKVSGTVRVSSHSLLTHHLGLTPERITPDVSKRLAQAMRLLGWDGPKTVRFSSTDVKRGFTRKYVEQLELPKKNEP